MPRTAAKPANPFDRLALRFSQHRRIDGLWIGCFGADDPALTLGRLEQALGLIKQYDPRRYDRLRRDLDRIWVNVLPGNWGEYRHAQRMCVLDERFVLSKTTGPEEIASTIVHEATHARLRRCGIGYEVASRARVEAVCFRRQRAFAAKLSAGERVKEDAERRLTGYPADFWAPRAFQERFDQGSADALRYLGVPEVLIRAAFRLRALASRLLKFGLRLRHPFRRHRET